MRQSAKLRETKETKINVNLNIDGNGNYKINTGIKFFDHMLEQLAHHAGFDLEIDVTSHDKDNHHVVEDVAITLGQAFLEALGDKKGVERYGFCILPMDEALVLSAIDFSGRSYLNFNVDIPTQRVGTFDTELVEEFWLAFTREAECTLHIKKFDGKNSHHIIEGAFKSVARSIKTAVKIKPEYKDEIMSTKGVL